MDDHLFLIYVETRQLTGTVNASELTAQLTTVNKGRKSLNELRVTVNCPD